MNWWELQPRIRPDGKAEYQECEVVFLSIDGTPRSYGSAFYLNATMQASDGMRGVPCSIMYFADTPAENKTAQLHTPVKCRVSLKSDTSQYAVNGYKYTIQLGDKTPGGFGGKGKFGFKASPEELYEKRLSVLLSYAKDAWIADKIEKSEVMATVITWSGQLDVMVAAKFETPQVNPV